MTKKTNNVIRDEVEEDGDEIFTPMPTKCLRFGCGGSVKPTRGFYVCDKCHGSYGPVVPSPGAAGR